MTQPTQPITSFPTHVSEALRECYLRIQNSSVASRLWAWVLTDEDRLKLGNDARQAYRDGGPVGMWMRLHGVSQPRAVLEVAKNSNLIDALMYEGLLRGIGAVRSTIDDAIQETVTSVDLVLVERDKEVFWKRRRIAIAWHRRPALWRFFWKLCASAQRRRSVDCRDFPKGPNDVSLDYVSKTKSTMVNLREFPTDLAYLIIPVGERSPLRKLSNLRRLVDGKGELPRGSMAVIAALPKLEHICVAVSNCDDEAIAKLKGHTSLSIIWLGGVSPTLSSVETFLTLPNIKDIQLTGSELATEVQKRVRADIAARGGVARPNVP